MSGAPVVAIFGGSFNPPHVSHVLAAATSVGKDVMPRVAALLDMQQISEITQVVSADTFLRPIYAGNALETVQSLDAIKIITVRATAFPLAMVVRDAIAGANRTLKRQVLLEPSMTAAHCIGKKTQLAAALRAFLPDSAMQESPVLVLREKSRDLELVIHDLDLGVPAGALDRVMNAPHHPPAGLEALGRLILAVEDSHGSMRVVSGRGWGSRLILRLHRARSVVMVGHSRHPSALAVSEGPTRISLPPAPRRPVISEPAGE